MKARTARVRGMMKAIQPGGGNDQEQQYKSSAEKDASEGSLHAVFAVDPLGRICEVNDTGANLLGFPADWLLGRAFISFVARQDVQRVLDLLLKSTRGTTTHQIEIDLYAGTRTVPVVASIAMTSDGSAYQLIIEDLTHSRDRELAPQSPSQWYSLVHNAPDTILTVDNRSRIRFINKPMWGYSVKALLGRNILDCVPEADGTKIQHCLTQAFRFRKRSVCEVANNNRSLLRWFIFKFGLPHSFDLSSAGRTSTRRAVTVVISEISEQKRAEHNLLSVGEQFRDFVAHADKVREDERTRVAREIHDELGQALTALKLDLAWLQKKGRKVSEIREKVRLMMTDVDNTIESVRRISSELRPPLLDDLGLIPAIEWQVTQFRKRTRIQTEFICKEDTIRVGSGTAAGVFRVIQEALTNVMRHAAASQVSIKIRRSNDFIRIAIVDNGVGMTKSQARDLKALGIVGMKERILRLGGAFQLFSEPGRGTRIEISVPRDHD